MSSQLVDINADGHKDIIVGSFSGTPQIIMGSEDGFAEPQPMKDAEGETILIAAFWNDETDEWDESDRSGSEGHCTSAFPIDWDNDGDLDLLLGDYYGGRLYLRMNEGTAKEPKFATKNRVIKAAGKPVVLKSGLSAPEVADWDGDGRFDILLGGSKGGVYMLRNTGTKTEPAFAAMTPLIKPVDDPKNSFARRVPAKDGQPTGPGSSFHIDACDYDGDGDLDLLVGSRCSWLEGPVKTLTDDEKDLLKQANADRSAAMAQLSKLIKDAGAEKKEDREELYASDEYKDALEKYRAAAEEVAKYKVDPSKTGDFVWLFRRR